MIATCNTHQLEHPTEDVRWKFREPSQRTLSMLINRELWFANTEELNDPFEKDFEYYSKFKEALETACHIDQQRKEIINNSFQRMIERQENKHVAVLSLCQTHHPSPMWSYYAKDHTGVALGFEFDEKKRDSDERFISFKSLDVTSEVEVLYLDSVGKQTVFSELIDVYNTILERTLNAPDELISEMIINQMIELAVSIKGPGWSHEKEKRHFLHREKESHSDKSKYFGEAQSFLDSELKHVIFGIYCDDEYKKTIKRILSDYDSGVKFWKAKKDTRRLIIDIEPATP